MLPPHCNEVLIHYEIDDLAPNGQKITLLPRISNIPDRFIYQDGDRVPLSDEQLMLSADRYEAMLYEGHCRSCEGFYWSTFFLYTSRSVKNANHAGIHYFDSFGYIESRSAEYYKIVETVPGVKIVHKGATVEEDPDDSPLEISEYILGPFKIESDVLTSAVGVSACNPGVESQLIWSSAAEAITSIIGEVAYGTRV